MRRALTPWIGLAVFGLVAGGAYRYFANDPSEATLANYLRSGLHGMGLALSGWAVHIYVTSRSAEWLRRWPLVVEIAVQSVVMAIVVATVAVILEPALYGHRIEGAWLISHFPRIVGVTFAASVVIGALFELTRLIGSRVLFNVIIGRYRRPTREQRVLLFLDLVGSTTLAESMGELRMHQLLTRFFYDIDEAILAHRGEVHAYVGDEVIVTWRLGAKGRSDVASIAVLPSRTGLRRRRTHTGASSAWYRIFAPERMRERCCKEVGRALLVSADLLRLAHPGSDLVVEALGPVQLRGRAAAVEVFAVERRPAGVAAMRATG